MGVRLDELTRFHKFIATWQGAMGKVNVIIIVTLGDNPGKGILILAFEMGSTPCLYFF